MDYQPLAKTLTSGGLMKRFMTLAVLVSLTATFMQAASFTLDPYHTTISFKVKHLVGKVGGTFDKFTGKINYDAGKMQNATVEATIEAASIDTGNEKRDEHLKTADFFDVAKYPTITFKSEKVTDVQGNKAKVHGQLTMHGVTKPVVLDVEMGDIVKDPTSNSNRTGGTAKTTVSRHDFGIGAASGPSAGMIGKDVEITIDFEATGK
jgi:polyisoprenoid-binding protein YceI